MTTRRDHDQTWDSAGNLVDDVEVDREVDLIPQIAEASAAAARIAVHSLVRADSLSDAEMAEVYLLFPSWAEPVAYAVGDVVAWQTVLWECIQSHTSQVDWEPQEVPALWKSHRRTEDGPHPWVQPQGAHDVYNTGEQVTHDGKTWESLIDNNVWMPGVHGWQELS